MRPRPVSYGDPDPRGSTEPAPVLSPRFPRRFWPLWLAGLAGVLSLLLLPLPAPLREAPGADALPPAALAALVLVNPLVLMTAGVLLGAIFAPRVGLASAIAGVPGARLAPGRAIAIGLGLALAIVASDAALAPVLGDAWARLRAQHDATSATVGALVAGMLYGGIAEELMMRWGLISLAAWAILRVTRAHRGRADGPDRIVMWGSIVLAAIAFAAGHLPALALAGGEPTAPVVLRTLVANGVAGLAYGWLAWRHGLESAMLAHAMTHVGFALLRVFT